MNSYLRTAKALGIVPLHALQHVRAHRTVDQTARNRSLAPARRLGTIGRAGAVTVADAVTVENCTAGLPLLLQISLRLFPSSAFSISLNDKPHKAGSRTVRDLAEGE